MQLQSTEQYSFQKETWTTHATVVAPHHITTITIIIIMTTITATTTAAATTTTTITTLDVWAGKTVSHTCNLFGPTVPPSYR